MLALVISIFIASLLGSLHCAGMCGAFLAIAVGGGNDGLKVKTQAAYHLGRLATYVTLGVFAGLTGSLVDLTGTLVGLKSVAASIAGAVMVAFGAINLLRLAGISFARLQPPGFLGRWLSHGHRAAMARPPVIRAGLIGLLTTLLPCGWLYAFVVAAAGTASPLTGAMTMAVFWLGTLPVLVGIGAGIQRVTGAFGRNLSMLTCVLLMVVGAMTLLGRANLDPIALAARVSPGSQVQVPDPSETPPCCVEKR